MSKRIGNVFVVQEETPQQCDDCGEITELRPYGPNGSAICFDCGMKDEAGTAARYDAIIEGIESVVVKGPNDD